MRCNATILANRKKCIDFLGVNDEDKCGQERLKGIDSTGEK